MENALPDVRKITNVPTSMNVVVEFALWLKSADPMRIAHQRNLVPLPSHLWDNVNVRMFAPDQSSVAEMPFAKLSITDPSAPVLKDSLVTPKMKKLAV